MAVNLISTSLPTGNSSGDSDLRRRLALAMALKAMNGDPVQSPWQGANKMAQALIAGMESSAIGNQQRDSALGMGGLVFPGAGPAPKSGGFLSGLFGGSQTDNSAPPADSSPVGSPDKAPYLAAPTVAGAPPVTQDAAKALKIDPAALNPVPVQDQEPESTGGKMPLYELQARGKTYEVEAPDVETLRAKVVPMFAPNAAPSAPGGATPLEQMSDAELIQAYKNAGGAALPPKVTADPPLSDGPSLPSGFVLDQPPTNGPWTQYQTGPWTGYQNKPPQRIDVPGMGIVEFPGWMSDDEISAAIKRNLNGQGAAQGPTLHQLETALRNADAAGDTPAAKQLAAAIIAKRNEALPPGFVLDQPGQHGQSDQIRISAGGYNLAFPGDAPNETVRAAIDKLPPDARQAALDQWAGQHVARERAGGGFGQAVGDTVRNLARGTAVGSWLDEANAGTSAALNAVSGGYVGAPYDESKAYQNALDRAVDKDSGWAGTAAQVVGGIASVPLMPWGMAARGASLLPQVAKGLGAGAAYGGIYGAGEGEGKDRLWNAATGAGIGGGIGGTVPLAARGLSNAAGYAAENMRGVPAELQPFHRGAVSRVAAGMADDAVTPQSYQQQVSALGPEGMIADLGTNARVHAETIANRPGRGAQILAEALKGRKEGAAGRIASDVDAALGPSPNLVEAEHAIRVKYGKAADPLYQQFRETPVPFTRDLEAIQNTLQAEPSIIKGARKLATLDGTADPKQFFAQIGDDGVVTINRVPNASEWDYIKRATDDLAREAGPGTNEQRIYGGVATKIRDAVDAAISPDNPGASIYAKAREIAGEGIGLRKAMEMGRDAFSRGVNPNQMAADMAGMSAAEREAYKMASRGQIADIMGNSATSFGESGDTAARRALGSEYAKKKLGMVAGDDAADRLINRLDTESTFQRTHKDVLESSATARRKMAEALYPTGEVGAPNLGDKTLTGLALEGGRRAVNALVGGALNERRARIAEDAASILSAGGPKRDALARALMKLNDTKAVTGQTKKQIEAVAKLLLRGPTFPLIGATENR